jgi:lipopolysaccharide biosynthesis protein
MSDACSPRRVMVYHHYDVDEVVDAHIVYQLKAFAEEGIAILFVSHSRLSQEEQNKIEPFVIASTLRENEGFDWSAWRHVLLARGKDFFASYDELILANCSCYGPLFPLGEMFERMAQESCDFWMPTNHLNAMGFPAHGQPYFAVIRKRLLESPVFWSFWETLPVFKSLGEAVWQGEIRFSTELSRAGFTYRTYYVSRSEETVPEVGYMDPFCMNGSDVLVLKARMPFVKVKSVAERFSRLYETTGYFFESLIKTKSPYPQELIVSHLRRTQAVSSQKALPDALCLLSKSMSGTVSPDSRIAVCGYFMDKEDLLARLGAGCTFSSAMDLLVLVDQQACEKEIREGVAQHYPSLRTLIIRVAPKCADPAPSVLQAFHDLFDHYAYVILAREERNRLPEAISYRLGPSWLTSILSEEGWLPQLLGLFQSEARLGLVLPVLPPVLAIGKRVPQPLDSECVKVLNDAGVWFRQEPHVPVLTAGPCIVRASILRQLRDCLMAKKGALSLGKVSEDDVLNLLPYIAQSGGYYYKQALGENEIRLNYSLYEDFICSVQFKNKIIHYNQISFKEMWAECLKVFFGYLFYRFPGISRARTRLRCYRKGISYPGVEDYRL